MIFSSEDWMLLKKIPGAGPRLRNTSCANLIHSVGSKLSLQV